MNLVESQREQVKQDFPGLNFIDVGKKLGEMWREMDPAVKKEARKAEVDSAGGSGAKKKKQNSYTFSDFSGW